MSRNRLLMLVAEEDRRRMAGDLVLTSLPLTRKLYGEDGPVDAVYFPVDAVVSLLEGAGEASPVEVATIGNEGATGVCSLLGPGRPIAVNMVQVAGDALRIDLARFRALLGESPRFQRLMHRYVFALTRQTVLAGACNRLHTTEERCARWLLMTQDRAGSDSFALTQELLSDMLGVRRATVNTAIGILRRAGFIRYVRGQITVSDRAGLESASCPCYELIRNEYAGLGIG